jgi:formylmethanofuran dehydrogenase subunit E
MKDFIDTLSADQKAALLAALADKYSTSSVLLPKEVNEQTKQIIKDDFTMTKQSELPSNGRRAPVKAKENTWKDTGSDAKGIETPDIQPTPRTRQPPKKKTVKCHVCGKNSVVNANLVYGEFYRCDRCIG